MPRRKEPASIVEKKARSHLGKAEIERRKQAESPPPLRQIVIPDDVDTEEQRQWYLLHADWMDRLGIWGTIYARPLADLVHVMETEKEASVRTKKAVKRGDLANAERWSRIQERAFKQERALRSELCLTPGTLAKIPPRAREEAGIDVGDV
ncbi:hypothetical protein JI75_02545 [Berryella intestinalis]|uniref:Phage terminase small subunit P27 family n=1 Tax=Berryella intestinalis TaxID=1531429 RepID=A0A0A8B2X2_9ACTN|nr:hypothetical protein [Berryella intestinalis]AJC11714.1 hypothetical protein JI75_02545 [Berryella intestinalis]